jgi:Flp pilus assembly protein TadB
MSLKIGDLTIWNDDSIGTNEIRLPGSLFEKGGELHERSHIVKIKTKGNKRIYLNAKGGSKKDQIIMHSDLTKRLKKKTYEEVEISRCGRIDKVIQILTSCNLAKVFSTIAAAFAIALVILVVILPFLYIIWMIIVFFIIFISLVILLYVLRLFIIKSA